MANSGKKYLLFFLAVIMFGKIYCYKNLYNFSCPEKKIVVVIPSYKNKQWYRKNLDSIRTQNYSNYTVIYVNDCSPDGTGELVKNYIQEYKLEEKFQLIDNETRIGALANLYKSIYSCKNDDIIVTVDGDDWLAHRNVLKMINGVYQDPNVWLTYGQYKAVKGKYWYCTNFPLHIVKNNKFRYKSAFISHLRTFYAGLFKLIKTEDLMYNGEFYSMTWDKAMMFPMIEMTGGKFKCIRSILYMYNDINPINDHKVDEELQKHLSEVVLAKKPYQPATWKDILNA